jgi:hypothetical protein
MRGPDLQAVIVVPHRVILKREVLGYENYGVSPVLLPPLFYWYHGSNAKVHIDSEGTSRREGENGNPPQVVRWFALNSALGRGTQETRPNGNHLREFRG